MKLRELTIPSKFRDVVEPAPVYQMTPRAELALTLSRTDLDKLIKEADYAKVIQMLQTLTHH